MNELALFAGAGGGLLATTHLLKWRTVCYVEWDEYCVKVIQQRIKDGYLHDAPIWDDVRTFDGRPWAGRVDIVTAGFPCQPFSNAGKQEAESDERNLWPDTARIIGEVRPQHILLENVTGIVSSGYIATIYGDLAQLGYDARRMPLSAADVGANHLRERQWIQATHANSQRLQRGWTKAVYRISSLSWGKDIRSLEDLQKRPYIPTPLIYGVANGVAHRVDRLKAIGSGQVPAVVSTVWRLLTSVR